ncbi:unnamed protein product [Lota lota]
MLYLQTASLCFGSRHGGPRHTPRGGPARLIRLGVAAGVARVAQMKEKDFISEEEEEELMEEIEKPFSDVSLQSMSKAPTHCSWRAVRPTLSSHVAG